MFEIYLFALNEYMSIIIIEFTMNIEWARSDNDNEKKKLFWNLIKKRMYQHLEINTPLSPH